MSTSRNPARDREIVRRAQDGEPYTTIGRDFGISRKRAAQIARAAGVAPRPHRTGADAGRWTGGRRRTAEGYVRVYAPKHRRARRRYVLEHVRVAEERLGRQLRRNEHVHHINGDPSDNRPENLRVMEAGEHSRFHHLRYSDALLIDWLRWLALQLGHTPRYADLLGERVVPAPASTYRKRFGSLNAALAAAGLTPNGAGGRGSHVRPLPSSFAHRWSPLARFGTAQALADELHGGTRTAHERTLRSE